VLQSSSSTTPSPPLHCRCRRRRRRRRTNQLVERVFIENNYQHVSMCEGHIRTTFIPVRSSGARAWVRADVRRGWRGEDRMCMCIREEGRQNIWRVWKSVEPCETRRRRRNERTEKAEEEANVYRTRHCIKVEVDDSTATRRSRKTCMFWLFSVQHSRLVCVVLRRTSKRETTRCYAMLRAYHHRWVFLFSFLADL